ncbi:MAG: holo-ACP synthase [Dehalococcoidales bacterium]|nr:holo-ACP synthase [Dehalococcoidales bacterium]
MSRTHIGVDIIEISRIRSAVERWGDKFLNRIYTVPELERYRGKTESLAARFAGKEAAMKALNLTGLGVSWREVEILSTPGGKPTIRLYGRMLEKANSLGLGGLEITISHSRENAIALVFGVKEV